MGSDSDWVVMKAAADFLKEQNIPYETAIISAHRTPHRALDYATKAHTRGLKVIIAGAGGAAHLAGVIASLSPLPIIGVPVKSSISLDGWDSILSILQMPSGIPVATVALNGAKNAGILAMQILATADATLQQKVLDYKARLAEEVIEKGKAFSG